MSLNIAFREPGLNEKRCIVRHGLSFYHGLAVAAIYNLSSFSLDLKNAKDVDILSRLITPLSACVHEHPILSAVIDDQDIEKPTFHRAANIDLLKHVQILKAAQFTVPVGEVHQKDTEEALLQKSLEHILNDDFDDVSKTPPWRVYLLPLAATESHGNRPDEVRSPVQRLLIVFAFSHSHGDGLSGLIFHRSFSKALVDATYSPSTDNATNIPTSDEALPAAIDFPTSLPISWTYLLSTIVNEFVPKHWLSIFKSSRNSRTPSTSSLSSSPTGTVPWLGRPCFKTNSLPRTAVHPVTIPSQILATVLAAGRHHQTKLTGILHQVIVNTLCKELETHGIHTSTLATETPIDLRKPHGTPSTTMGVMASTLPLTLQATPLPTSLPSLSSSSPSLAQQPNHSHGTTADKNTAESVQTGTTSDEDIHSSTFWSSARHTTAALSGASASLSDQPIGLLRYVSSLRAWHTDKLDHARGSTYELSNIMVFSDESGNSTSHGETKVRVEKMLYAQAADVGGPVMSFNVVSVEGGDLVVSVSWQVGAMGFGAAVAKDDESRTEALEREFIGRVAEDIQRAFRTLAQM